MPYCQKCGSKTKEEMTFCPQCGASLAKGLAPTVHYRSEKAEKQEKQEKQEKEEKMEKGEQQEKYEKREYGVLGPLIGGIILIIVGFMAYLVTTEVITFRSILPFVLVIIGVVVIIGVIVGVATARGRNPRT